jgi:hypothetical protein
MCLEKLAIYPPGLSFLAFKSQITFIQNVCLTYVQERPERKVSALYELCKSVSEANDLLEIL